jgi:hypothetical protein
MQMSSGTIKRLNDYIAAKQSEGVHIHLLNDKTVIQWLFGDVSFLPEVEKSKNKQKDNNLLKIEEDKWGRDVMKKRRPDLKLDKQWTNKLGEHLCEEIYALHGKTATKPVKKQNHQPDLEVDDAIIEAKTQTFYTDGTAGEKILGCSFKYSSVPNLYGRPLKIVCIGGAEKKCRDVYGILPGPKCTPEKKERIDFDRSKQIEYIGATDLLVSLIQ